MKTKKTKDMVTSIRLPVDLKDKVDVAAEKAGQSMTGFIITALEQRLRGMCETCGRDGVHQLREVLREALEKIK